MANILLIVTLGLCYISCIKARTIKEIINDRDELVKLKEYMEDLDFYNNQLHAGGDKKYTFFAPNNSAFSNIPQDVRTRFSSGGLSSTAKQELDDIFHYHAAFVFDEESEMYVTYRAEEMGNQKVTSSAKGEPNLFFRTVESDYFVNGAHLLPGDDQNIVADNGIVHIIDTFLYEQPITMNALGYMLDHTSDPDKNMRFSIFADLFAEYKKQMAHTGVRNAYDIVNSNSPMTLFLPSDTAMEKLSTTKRLELKDDVTKLTEVMESHVVKGAYHSGVLLQVGTVQAITGEVIVSSYLNRMYVSNNCAKGSITTANITVTNGAVHVVDGLLGYAYSDIMDILDEYSGLDDFYLLVQGVTEVVDVIDIPDTTTDVADEDLYTMFAPISSGMKNTGFSGNAAHEKTVVQMHMLGGRHELATMTVGLQVPTLEPDQNARFFQVNNNGNLETYVQVNYVRAKIVDSDICVRNGIVHTIDHILGLPSTTMLEYIENLDDLRSLYEAIRKTGMDTVLNDVYKVQTFLAPSNKAFDAMSQQSQGQKLLDIDNRQFLKNVMERQLLNHEFIMDKMQGNAQTVTTSFKDETISVQRDGSKYIIHFDGRLIPVKTSDIRMKNGMLHIIDEVLFSYREGASEWISGAGHLRLACVLYWLLVCTILFACNLFV